MDTWENRYDAVVVAAFEAWTKNGLGNTFEENEEAIKTCRDAATNAWIEGMHDGEWLAATLARLNA
jgi:hypothetical protein